MLARNKGIDCGHNPYNTCSSIQCKSQCHKKGNLAKTKGNVAKTKDKV